MATWKRGTAIAALNRLVEGGLIASFKTNFFGANREPEVTVRVMGELSEAARAQIAAAVRDELAPITGRVAVNVEREPTASG